MTPKDKLRALLVKAEELEVRATPGPWEVPFLAIGMYRKGSEMKSLFDTVETCQCNHNGVITEDGKLKFCSCPDGVRERAENTSGFSQFIGRRAGEVVSELQQRLKGEANAN